jgi:aminoglycoside 6'-N-acetyltransferase I
MEIRVLGPADLDLLCAAEDGLFDNPVRPDEARAFLASPLHEIVVALAGRRILAFASGTVLLHPDKAPGLFVNEVGTRDGHQRRGLATAVCRALFARARARGCEGIWLGTEPDNAPALALYRTLGGTECPFVGFGWDGAFEDG